MPLLHNPRPRPQYRVRRPERAANDPARGWGAYAGDGTWLQLDWDDFDTLLLGGSAECIPCGYGAAAAAAVTEAGSVMSS
jgi:hypothetical protein